MHDRPRYQKGILSGACPWKFILHGTMVLYANNEAVSALSRLFVILPVGILAQVGNPEEDRLNIKEVFDGI